MVIAQDGIGQTVPYFALGRNAQFDPISGDYAGEGRGLHLGRHEIRGNVLPDGEFFPEPDIFFEGTFTGTQTVIAANGDTIEMEMYGDVLLEYDAKTNTAFGTWYPNFEIVEGGTGRFANASGFLSGEAVNPPFEIDAATWPFDWFIEGEIDLGKKRGR